MIKLNNSIVGLAVLFLVLVFAASSMAAVNLKTSGVYEGWIGSTPFANADGLNGHIDWAVYSPGDFPYSGLKDVDGTSFSAPDGEYAYVYQVYGDIPTASILMFSIAAGNSVNNIGTFDTGDVIGGGGILGLPVYDNITADWYFNDGVPPRAIGGGQHSVGLVYFSSLAPSAHEATIQDHGTAVTEPDVPAPIPEPTTIVVWTLGAGLVLIARRFRLR